MKLFKKNEVKILPTKNSLLDKIGWRIYWGPFSGVRIPAEVIGYLTVSEILGFYESCLHRKINNLLNKQIKNIIVVGANNGYYAAGLSFLLNPLKMNVYESDTSFHGIISSWFSANALSPLNIYGKATSEEFEKISEKIDFLLMDCEGYEVELLNPKLFPWQKDTEILLELHPFYVDKLVAIISQRFSETHKLKIIYDNFSEDRKIEQILNGLDLAIAFSKHPCHRWIEENNSKVFTSGSFMYLSVK